MDFKLPIISRANCFLFYCDDMDDKYYYYGNHYNTAFYYKTLSVGLSKFICVIDFSINIFFARLIEDAKNEKNPASSLEEKKQQDEYQIKNFGYIMSNNSAQVISIDKKRINNIKYRALKIKNQKVIPLYFDINISKINFYEEQKNEKVENEKLCYQLSKLINKEVQKKYFFFLSFAKKEEPIQSYFKSDNNIWLSTIISNLSNEKNSDIVDEYKKKVNKLGEIIYQYLNNSKVDIIALNEINYYRNQIENSFLKLLFDFGFRSFTKELSNKKIIARCCNSDCRNFILKLIKTKKYCSLNTEAKSCFKSAKNKEYYKRVKNKK